MFGPLRIVDDEWNYAIECFVNAGNLVPNLFLLACRTLAMHFQNLDDLPEDCLDKYDATC